MKKKATVVLSGIVITVILMAVYIYFRRDFIETNFIEKITGSAEAIEGFVKEYKRDFSEVPRETANIRAMLIALTEHFPNVGAAIIADKDYHILEMSRNYTILESNTVFNSFQADFTAQKIAPTTPNAPLLKIYEYSYGGKQYSSDLYVFVKDIDNYKLSIVYPFTLDKRILLRLAVELFLVIIIITIATSLLYISSNMRKRIPDDSSHEDVSKNEDEFLSPKEEFDDYEFESVPNGILIDENDNDVSTLNNLLYVIMTESGGSNAAIFIQQNGLFTKVCEVDTEYDSGIDLPKQHVYETIEFSLEQEIRNSTAFLSNEGQQVLLSLKKDGELYAIIEIKRDMPFNSDDIRAIRQTIKEFSTEIFDFVHSGKFDSYAKQEDINEQSNTDYYIKLNELKKAYLANGIDFSVLFISCFDKMEPLTDYQREQAYAFIIPEIQKYINPQEIICEYDNYLAILMKDAGSSYAEITGERIDEALSKFRLKLKNNDDSVPIRAVFAVASTDMGLSPDDLTSEAERNLRKKI